MHSVVIADDEKLICDGIRSVIEADLPELTITHIFEDGAMLYEYLESHQPDIIILDIAMPGKSGLDVARLIESQGHNSYVIIITAHQLFEYAKEAIENIDVATLKHLLAADFSQHENKNPPSFVR